jgi:predicted nuclease with TOPRIM domain
MRRIATILLFLGLSLSFAKTPEGIDSTHNICVEPQNLSAELKKDSTVLCLRYVEFLEFRKRIKDFSQKEQKIQELNKKQAQEILLLTQQRDELSQQNSLLKQESMANLKLQDSLAALALAKKSAEKKSHQNEKWKSRTFIMAGTALVTFALGFLAAR